MKTDFEWAVGRCLATFFPQGAVHTLTSSLIVFPSLSCLMIPRFGFRGASSSFLTSHVTEVVGLYVHQYVPLQVLGPCKSEQMAVLWIQFCSWQGQYQHTEAKVEPDNVSFSHQSNIYLLSK